MVSPRSAAAVILVRETPELEVFWVRRGLQMMFQPGFHAFPGGQLDPDEDMRVCAARELFEEVGVRVDSKSLIDVGRWVTPAFAPRRFDTCFFLAKCPAGETARVMTDEHDFGEWIRPADAIEKWMEGEVLMATPIMHALRCLSAGLDDIEARMKVVPSARGEAIAEIEMRPGIVLVPLRTPTLPPATHTNCYVVGGDEVVVIDPASPYAEEQEMLDRVLEKRNVREIWLTHLHADHVGGANHLRQKRGVKIAAHPITARDLAGTVDVDRTFAADERLELAGRPGWRLRVIHTPGHARGHVCIFDEKSGSLITGDLMAGLGTVVIDPPEGHMATYFESLRRMHELPVTALFPAHGPVMANARWKIGTYLEHRVERENNILAAWKRGLRETSDIVKDVYTDVSSTMYGLAARSVLAHLEKLREEQRI
jgi:ribonuclease/clavin/mitogillin